MIRLVDGLPFTAPTHCRCGADVENSRYNGPMETCTPATWLLLATCNECRTTFTLDAVHDACKCHGCGWLVLGDFEDPKCCTFHGVYCLDCAEKLTDEQLGPALAENRLAAKTYYEPACAAPGE